MDPEEVELRREEYYESLADTESLHEILNQHAGLVLARVGSYPPWPARFSEPGEYAKMSKYRLKKSHVCVYFFGTRNFGWVPKSSILSFSTDVSVLKTAKKYNAQLMQEALDEARFILDGTDASGLRFYDRIMERRDEPVDLPCEICNRVDDHYSNLILCDGVDCKREFHMNCLVPPLLVVPPGDWYCPECAKDPSKQLPRGAAAAGDAPDDDAATGGKRAKKDKSLKRRLAAEGAGSGSGESLAADAARAASAAKKSRGSRGGGESSSVESSPARSAAVADASPPAPPAPTPRKPAALDLAQHQHQPAPMSMPFADAAGDDELDVDSDDRCLICGYGGELVVCEFPGCAKVYHQFCLGAYPFPKDDDEAWECPRHTCALTGEKERLALDADPKGRGASPRKPVAKNLLWKCSQCPLAIASDKFPPLPTTSLLSKKLKTFLCPNCSPNAPAKVQLGRVLERVWSTMATNRQGMPFCGPLLAGVEGDADFALDAASLADRRALDLFTILAKIRGLEYEQAASFVDDVRALVANALALIGRRSEALAEAARTVQLICSEQTGIHQALLAAADAKVKRSKLEARKQKEQKDGGPWSWKRKWPVQWRQECGGAARARFPHMEPRSLAEWTAFVTSAPLFATGAALDDRLDAESSADDADGLALLPPPPLPPARAAAIGTASAVAGGGIGSSGGEAPSFPGLSLAEGTDVMMALGALARGSRRPAAPLQLGGAREGEMDDVDGRDFFLSPSTSEMQHMFAQQSLLLRQALEAQTALQKAWLLSQHQVLGLGDHNGFSVGEGRLAAELRLANKNLRARLRNKDRLVDQLTADHTALRSELAALQKELSESKLRVQQLERRSGGGDAGEEKDADDDGASTGGDAANGVSSGEDAPQRTRLARAVARKVAK